MAVPIPTRAAIEIAKLNISESESEVSTKVCEFIIDLSNKSIEKNGRFTIGLSGGSMAKILCAGLPDQKTDWSKWFVFFCDERHVPYDNAECTYTIYKKGLFDKVNIPAENIFPDDPSIPVNEAAERYQASLSGVFGGDGLPSFDLLMLGMGPDGHTCSLFPGHELLEETSKRVAAISDSPKPPPERITFTYPLINNAQNAMFVAVGEGKADTVRAVLEGREEPLLPASRVQPTGGSLHWFLDTAAAADLTATTPAAASLKAHGY